MPDVVGFQPNSPHLELHCGSHAARLVEHGIIDEASAGTYERAAIEVLSRPLDGLGLVIEGKRKNADRVRWNQETREFGVVCTCGYVHTYYLLDEDKYTPEFTNDRDYFYGQLGSSLQSRPCCKTRRAG